MKPWHYHCRWASRLMAGWIAAGAGTADGQTGIAYQVGYLNLTSQATGENPASFVASLDAVPRLSATLAEQRLSTSWRAVPEGVAPAQWIRLVRVQVGSQCDFFVFLFADRDGTLEYAGRRPSRIPVDPPKYPLTVAPGPNQIPANAIRETATDFLHRFPVEGVRERVPLQIVIEPADREPVTRDRDGMGLPGAHGWRDLPREQAETVAFAAAFQAGWRPTAGPGDRSVRLSVTEVLDLYNTVMARTGDGDTLFERRDIPRERLYDHLIRLFFRLREADRVFDVAPWGAADAQPLAWSHGLAIVQNGQTIKALDPSSGRLTWSQPVGERETPRFRMGPGSDKGADLLRYDNGIIRVNLQEGAPQHLAPPRMGADGWFDVAADGRVAVVESNQVHVYQGDGAPWIWDGDAAPLAPLWGGNRLFVVGADEILHALDPAAREERWRVVLEGDGDPRLAFQSSLVFVETERDVTAYDAEDGTRRWRIETGDLLLHPPRGIGDRILVAVKQNRLLLVDAGSGDLLVSRRWPTWLHTVDIVATSAGTAILCLDYRNRLSRLDPDTLQTESILQFPAAMTARAVFGRDVPVQWVLERPVVEERLEEGLFVEMTGAMVPRQPAWMVQDVDGFVYAVTVDREAGP